MINRRYAARMVVILLLVGLVAGACSSSKPKATTGSSPTSGSPATTGSSATTAGGTASGSPVKVGFLIGETGNQASIFAVAVPIIKAWASYANANGGLAGHPVDPVIIDSQSQSASALAGAKTLVSDGVVAVMTGDAADEILTGPYFASQNVANFGLSYVSVSQTLKNVYNTGISTAVEASAEVAVGKADGYTKMFAIGCLESPVCKQNEEAYKAAAPGIGVTYEGNVLVSFGQPSYTAECLQAISSGAQYLQLDLPPSEAKTVASTCVQQGFKGAFGAPESGADIAFLKTETPGTKWTGVLNGFPWWVDNPQVNAFRTAVQTYSPGADYQTPTATFYWAALETLRKALSGTTGDVTAQTVNQALGSLQNESLGGLLAEPVTFSPNQMGNKVSCYWGYTYTAGDANPAVVPVVGQSGNGQNGPLASSCFPPK